MKYIGVAREGTFSLTFSDKENGRQRTTTLTLVPLSSAVWGRLDIVCDFLMLTSRLQQPAFLESVSLNQFALLCNDAHRCKAMQSRRLQRLHHQPGRGHFVPFQL